MTKDAVESNDLSYFLFSVNNAALFHCVIDKQPFSDTCESSGLSPRQADKESDFE